MWRWFSHSWGPLKGISLEGSSATQDWPRIEAVDTGYMEWTDKS